MMKGRYDFGGGAPEPKYKIPMPEGKYTKTGTLREILGVLPDSMVRRITGIWVSPDGTISIDLEAQEEEREDRQNSAEGERE